jgi:hypothetical protein
MTYKQKGEVDSNFVLSHPFAGKKANGWGTQSPVGIIAKEKQVLRLATLRMTGWEV